MANKAAMYYAQRPPAVCAADEFLLKQYAKGGDYTAEEMAQWREHRERILAIIVANVTGPCGTQG